MPLKSNLTKPPSKRHERRDPSDKNRRVRQKVARIRAMEGEIAGVLKTMEEKVRQLEGLTRFSAILNSTLDTATVREKALEATCELLVCETASLLLVDPKTGELYWETALGAAGKKLEKSVRLPINDRSIAGYVAMTAESLIVNDVPADPRHNRKVTTDARGKPSFQALSMLCVPLRVKDRTIGVLQAINRKPTALRAPTRHAWADFHDDDLRILHALAHQVAVAIDNARLYEKLKNGFYETVQALAEAIEKKDRYTGGHTKRVVHYSMAIARHLPLTPEELDRVKLGAVLHDVGKIGIEDKILKKAAPLDPYEWPVMKTHPELGYQIMSRVEGLKDVVAGMRYHHERWDGKGYPLGLKGEEIPLLARIIAVADTYDAMVSTRPYRKGLAPEVARAEIARNSGTQFCPTVAAAFEKAFADLRGA